MKVAGERAAETNGDGAHAAEASGAESGKTLGERIVEAARLAVAVHLFESLAASTQHYGQQFAIGGAGPVAPATAARVHARRPFRITGDDGADEGREAGSR